MHIPCLQCEQVKLNLGSINEHGAQPGDQEGRSAEKRSSAPLTFTLGEFSYFGVELKRLHDLIWRAK
jgi:hypothetical protein